MYLYGELGRIYLYGELGRISVWRAWMNISVELELIYDCISRIISWIVVSWENIK